MALVSKIIIDKLFQKIVSYGPRTGILLFYQRQVLKLQSRFGIGFDNRNKNPTEMRYA